MDNSTVLQNCLLSNFYNLITVRLDDSNYVTWRFLVETMFAGCGLIRYIDGSFPRPPQHIITEEGGVMSDMTKEYMDWVQNDSVVMSILAATLSNDVLSFIVGSKTSREIWCRLKEKYASASAYNIMTLKTSLYNIQKGSDSIDRYLLRVKLLCDQLATVGIYLADEDIIVSVLHGLPAEFATIKTIIRIKTLRSSVSMEELRSLLLIAEDEINQTVMSMSLSSKTAMAAFGDTSRAQATNAACVSSDMMFTSSIAFPTSEYMMRRASSNDLNCGSMVIENESAKQLVTEECVQKEEAEVASFVVKEESDDNSTFDSTVAESQSVEQLITEDCAYEDIQIPQDSKKKQAGEDSYSDKEEQLNSQEHVFLDEKVASNKDKFLQEKKSTSFVVIESTSDSVSGSFCSIPELSFISPLMSSLGNKSDNATNSRTEAQAPFMTSEQVQEYNQGKQTFVAKSTRSEKQRNDELPFYKCKNIESGLSLDNAFRREYHQDFHDQGVRGEQHDDYDYKPQSLLGAYLIQGSWQLLSTPSYQTKLHCRQASYPLKLCQSLPLIDPG